MVAADRVLQQRAFHSVVPYMSRRPALFRAGFQPEFFHLPEFRPRQKNVHAPVRADNEAAPAVAKALQPQVAVEERPARPHDQLVPAKRLSVLPQFVGLIAGVTVEVAQRLAMNGMS